MKYQAPFCIVALSLIFFACRKSGSGIVDIEQSNTELRLTQTQTIPAPLNLLAPFPAHGDSNISSNVSLSISLSWTRDPFRVSKLSFKLFDGSLQIAGRVILNDTNIVFKPSEELDRNRHYTVVFDAELIVSPEDPALERYVIPLHEEWNFVTEKLPKYIAGRHHQWITGVPRDGSEMAQLGNDLYLYGGWTGEELHSYTYNEIYRSSGDLTVWEAAGTANWSARHTFGTGILGGALYVFGGDHLYPDFDVWKTTDGLHFEKIFDGTATGMGPRMLYGGLVHDNKLWVVGGQRSLGMGEGVTDIWNSSDGANWNRVSTGLHFVGRNISGGIASFKGRIWLLGGGYYGHPEEQVKWTNEVYSSADGIQWTKHKYPPWKPRQYANACVWDDRLWIIGGNAGDDLRDVWYMDKTGRWVEVEMPPEYGPRHASAVGVYNNKLVIAGGTYQNDCWTIERE